jgi:hypothetical protein
LKGKIEGVLGEDLFGLKKKREREREEKKLRMQLGH